jgi:hypothetical protein
MPRMAAERRTYRCMMGFAMDRIGAGDGTCVGVGLVGEGGKATGSSVSEKGTKGG